MTTPKELISLLGLQPHPEGGYFKETFKDSDKNSSGRAASSLIYFLIEAGNVSRLHRIDAAEAWHFYAGGGDGMEVVELQPDGPIITKLGTDFAAGQRPQYVVPKDRWFGARVPRVEGSWALVGCTVAPAFEFEKFELGDQKTLLQEFPACRDVIREMTVQDESNR